MGEITPVVKVIKLGRCLRLPSCRNRIPILVFRIAGDKQQGSPAHRLPLVIQLYLANGKVKVRALISNVGVSGYGAPDSHGAAVVIEAEAVLIDGMQAGMGVCRRGKQGKEYQTGQDYGFSVLANKEKQGEGDKSGEDEG
ncbi:hypothetical protein ES703_39164 [subsurface metagenome]